MVKNFHKAMVMCVDMCMVTLANEIYRQEILKAQIDNSQ